MKKFKIILKIMTQILKKKIPKKMIIIKKKMNKQFNN